MTSPLKPKTLLVIHNCKDQTVCHNRGAFFVIQTKFVYRGSIINFMQIREFRLKEVRGQQPGSVFESAIVHF